MSETSIRMVLPTCSGSMCWYRSGSTLIAEACRPALWAKAETPTYGWWVEGVRLTTSAMACEMRVISRSAPSGRTFLPYFSSRAATTGKRLALPTRSP